MGVREALSLQLGKSKKVEEKFCGSVTVYLQDVVFFFWLVEEEEELKK